jgi:recombination protein RecA
MSKYDLNSVIQKVQKGIKDEKLKKSVKMGTDMAIVSKDPADYVVLPETLGWSKATGGLLGLPFGKLVQIAGVSDSGKTSFAVTAMKAAQEQGVPVLFVETELKTSRTDLEAWGVDTGNVMLVQSSVSEEAFSLMFECWDAYFDSYPGSKLLVIIDSWGNTISMRDEGLDLTTQNIQPGGAAKTNRLSVNKMIAKMQTDKVALLISNYSYANLGSVGETAAGGRAIHFFTYVGFFTKRIKDLTKTVKGEKVKTGVQVRWRAFKNHAAKGSELNVPHSVDFEIDSKGMRMVGANSDESGSED